MLISFSEDIVLSNGRARSLVLLGLALALAATASAAPAAAQAGQGFTLERYEPSPAGQWSFWIDHPEYSEPFKLKAGLTFDYGHHPLVLGIEKDGKFVESTAVVSDQVYGHLDLAATMLNTFELSLSLPAMLYQAGHAAAGISPGDFGIGDPRVGVMVRLLNDPLRDAFSIHAGAQLWLPFGSSQSHAGDDKVRVAPRVVFAGMLSPVMWSVLTELMYRNQASIGTLPQGAGNSVGSELHLGARLAYANLDDGYSIGPEAEMATVVTDGNAFRRSYTSLEILFGGQYKIDHTVLAGVAAGVGALREPGNPDARVIVRVAYAPDEKKKEEAPPPPSDRDHDGILDAEDDCPDTHHGPNPDRSQPGCPRGDRDHDRVFDDEDACPDTAGVRTDDASTNGCPPPPDRDGDGVIDAEDFCPDTPKGEHPDSAQPGCPLSDRDADGVYDREDQCPDEPQGDSPHPTKPGCPTVKQDTIVVDPIFFKTDKAEILPESIPVVQSVADIMNSHPEFARVSIEGHTDNQGRKHANMKLSKKRAEAVMSWLASHGVAMHRLEAHGYGPTRPIADNDTEEGRAKNRRVQFVIVKRKD
jgi:outer membrane protein OmpA-like peptidoglycan-associated protein